jgi:hypothetical protein
MLYQATHHGITRHCELQHSTISRLTPLLLLACRFYFVPACTTRTQASPFVTGGFALCYLSGACKLSSSPGLSPAPAAAAAANYPLLLGAARSAACGSKGRCGSAWGSSYEYGYMLNLKQLWL